MGGVGGAAAGAGGAGPAGGGLASLADAFCEVLVGIPFIWFIIIVAKMVWFRDKTRREEGSLKFPPLLCFVEVSVFQGKTKRMLLYYVERDLLINRAGWGWFGQHPSGIDLKTQFVASSVEKSYLCPKQVAALVHKLEGGDSYKHWTWNRFVVIDIT